MRITIQGAGTQTASVQNGVFDGLLVSLTSTTIADITTAVLETVNFNLIYQQQGGGSFTVLSGNLFALGFANNIGSYEGQNIDGTINFFIGFGSLLGIDSGDNLTLTVSVGSSITGMNTYVSTNSQVGIPSCVPIVTIFPLDPTVPNRQVTVGDNVTRLSVINTTATSITASQRIQSMQISADSFQGDYIAQDLQALIAEQWTRDPSYYACAVYANNSAPINRVVVNYNVNTGATSNGYIVAFGGVVNPITKQRLLRVSEKVTNKVAEKFLPVQ
jgi:hypothetical protein